MGESSKKTFNTQYSNGEKLAKYIYAKMGGKNTKSLILRKILLLKCCNFILVYSVQWLLTVINNSNTMASLTVMTLQWFPMSKQDSNNNKDVTDVSGNYIYVT